MLEKIRVKEISARLEVSNKEVIEVLSRYLEGSWTLNSVLSETELDVIFEHYSVERGVENFDAYFALAEQRPKKEKPPQPGPEATPVAAPNGTPEAPQGKVISVGETPRGKSFPGSKVSAPVGNSSEPGRGRAPVGNSSEPGRGRAPVGNSSEPGRGRAPAGNSSEPGRVRAPAGNSSEPGRVRAPAEGRPEPAKPPKRPGRSERESGDAALARAAQMAAASETAGLTESSDAAKKKKEGNPQARTRGEQRTVDTRAGNVELEKYNERYEQIAPGQQQPRRNDTQQASKQKLSQKSKQYRKQGMRSSRHETEAERLRRIAAERAKKPQLIIKVGEEIQVTELALRLKRTAAEVVKNLFVSFGQTATVNDIIDFETAELVAAELGAKVEREIIVTIEERIIDDSVDADEHLFPRDPVVVVMGHVDHGKTSLLDTIRNTTVTETEAGGITQHIGAYRVEVHDKWITFLDTPGHAAFTAMRARGAQSTDIAILVVAADDGIMPQTVEAINHAKAAGVSIVVAVNKIDKPGANPERVLQQLTEHELVPEEWGGETICVPVSAKTGENMETLLESLLLVAEFRELRANPNRAAKGVVIEARLDRTRGPIATVLVQNGTLKAGDVLVAGETVGRVRLMHDHNGLVLQEAGPSVPVEIMGLAEAPLAGDSFDAVTDERLARELVEQRKQDSREEIFKQNTQVTLETLFDSLKEGEMKDLNIIVKADVQGSAEAVKQNLLKLTNEEVRVRVIHTGVGAVSESDVMLAGASGALIVGFNVSADPVAAANAERDGVQLRTYRIIYDMIEEVSQAIRGMLAPKYREVALGRVEVRQILKISSVGTVAGSYILDGKAQRGALVRIVRDGIILADDQVSSLRRFKDDVKEVAAGYECGITLEKFFDLQEGDIFELYLMEEYRD